MAFCIDFQLIKIEETKAVYRYGECGQKLDGLVELDVVHYINNVSNVPPHRIVRLLPSDTMSPSMAMRVFRKVYHYYVKHQRYPKQGSYFA